MNDTLYFIVTGLAIILSLISIAISIKNSRKIDE